MSSPELRKKIIFDLSNTFKCLDQDTNLREVVDEIITNYSQKSNEVWYSIWEERGDDILKDIWKSKYGHLLADNSEQETNTSEQETNTFEPETNNLQQIEEDWQTLWEEHVAEIYEKYYQHFIDAFWFHCCVLERSVKELNFDLSANSEIEDEEITQLASDVECMKLLGLPTSFCNPRKNPAKLNNNFDFTHKHDIDIFEGELEDTKDEDDEEGFYSSDSTDSDNLDMGKIKNAVAVAFAYAQNSAVAQLKKIQKKKKKLNRQLRHVPAFLREDTNLLKYWRKRYSLFSRFDEGIQLDQESWFSVTPENVARNLAQRLKSNVIIDGFCGCGGNTIQFAHYADRVIAIDIDASKIEMARNNAEIYGVAHKIEFIVDDFLNFCANTKLAADVVFLSPPWGGPNYKKDKIYDIETTLIPVGASELIQHARKISQNIAFFLPRNSNMQQVIKLAGYGNNCEIQQNYLDGRLIAITAFYGSNIIIKNQVPKMVVV